MKFWLYSLSALPVLTAGALGQAVFLMVCLSFLALFPDARDAADAASGATAATLAAEGIPSATPPTLAAEGMPSATPPEPPSAALSAPPQSIAAAISAELAEGRPALEPGLRDAIAAAIAGEAERQGIDPWLVYAVAWVESGFDPRSLGRAGERGLMQMLPATARSVAGRFGEPNLHPDRLFDPETNVRLGAAYLAELLRAHGGDPAKALTAYNSGRAVGAPSRYARRVLSRYEEATRLSQARPPAGAGRKNLPSVEPNRS